MRNSLFVPMVMSICNKFGEQIILSFKKIKDDDFADCAYKNNHRALRWSFSDLLDSNQLRPA